MDSTDLGALGPYDQFDGLAPLHARERGLPRLHPYGPVGPGRAVTPGGGRLTLESDAVHHRVTLDHLGCEAQTTEEKNAAFRRIARGAEAHCLLAGCTHPARHADDNVYRLFEVPLGALEPTAFVRMILAVELGDFGPGENFAQAAETVINSDR
ncbi:DUF6420 family protein [Kitasatospora purpeofusca]|uniref:DUF6420 family protein n=1 Tax=Kitasatospora purpeofusca TaxID=67352 RepID=UPI0035E335E1